MTKSCSVKNWNATKNEGSKKSQQTLPSIATISQTRVCLHQGSSFGLTLMKTQPVNGGVEHDDTNACMMSHSRTFVGMMKVIAGSLHGAVDCTSLCDNLNDHDEPINPNATPLHLPAIPTLTGVARKDAKSEGTQLDELQCIACETICCVFLLGLVNERAGMDCALRSHLQETLASNSDDESMELTIKEHKVRFG